MTAIVQCGVPGVHAERHPDLLIHPRLRWVSLRRLTGDLGRVTVR